MIRHIFFDIDDCLFPTSEFALQARKNAIRAMKRMGLAGREEHLFRKLMAIIRKKGSNYGKHFNELCRELKIKKPEKYIAAAIAAYHDTKASIQPYPEVPSLLLKLKKRFRIYVATNGKTLKQWDKLIRLGIAIYFDDVFISEDLKTEKSKKFFEMVLGRIGAKGNECLMVGDKEKADVESSKKAGMFAVKIGKKMEKTKADFTIGRMGDLEKVIKKLIVNDNSMVL